MKKLFTLFVLASVSLTSFGQVKNDPAAKKILDAVSAKFKTYKSPQAHFTYSVENDKGKVLSSQKGTVSMKGSKYKVTFPDLIIFSDGRTNWSYDKGANEVTVKDLDGSGDEMSPQKLFTNFYDKDFLYKLNGEKKIAGKILQEIELTPTNKKRPFHKVYVLVDKSTNTLYSTRILEKSGNRYVYTINSFKPTAVVADSEFVFDSKKFPGVEVIDLR